MDATEWKIWGFLGTAVIGLFGWFAKHTTNVKKHACTEDLVFSDVCKEKGRSNELAHSHLGNSIEAAIRKSDEQHKELKTDMRDGFNEIKSLIRNTIQ